MPRRRCGSPRSNGWWERTCEDWQPPRWPRQRCWRWVSPVAIGGRSELRPERRTRRPAAGAAATPAATSGDAATPARKIRFYRNPMGLPDTSPTPKKDPMGMDYIPVYEGEDAAADDGKSVKISVDRVQKLGVRTEPAALRVLERNVRALGRVEIDERRVVAVAPRFEGWVEKLHVNATGQPVAKGPAAVRGLRPGTRVGAARVPDRGQGRRGAEGRRRRRPGGDEPARRVEPRAPAQLGHPGRAT